MLRCPKCGQVYIPEDLAKGKMAQLEKSLEEKIKFDKSRLLHYNKADFRGACIAG